MGLLGAVVRLEPSWDALPPDVPPPVRTVLQRCLVQDPRRRIAEVAAALFVLDPLSGAAATGTVPEARRGSASGLHLRFAEWR